MQITVHIIVDEPQPRHYTSAFTLYVGDNQLFPLQTVERTFDSFFSARMAASDAGVQKVIDLRNAPIDFKTESRVKEV